MKILAIDTSSQNAIVTITDNEEKLVELNNDDKKTHSQKLMPMIDEAFRKTGLSLENIELISCCLGPGSFTGVRIGIATAKAFADSKDILTVGVNSLEELAYGLNEEGYICSLIDAGHGNTYTGLFKIERNKDGILQIIQSNLTFLSLKDENGRLSIKELMGFLEENIKKCENIENSRLQTVYFVGDATTTYKEILKLDAKNKYEIKIANENKNIASGITLAQLGYNKYKNGEYGNSSILMPVYLRKSQAELALEEKRGKNNGIRN